MLGWEVRRRAGGMAAAGRSALERQSPRRKNRRDPSMLHCRRQMCSAQCSDNPVKAAQPQLAQPCAEKLRPDREGSTGPQELPDCSSSN
jgi:hypothetical protein